MFSPVHSTGNKQTSIPEKKPSNNLNVNCLYKIDSHNEVEQPISQIGMSQYKATTPNNPTPGLPPATHTKMAKQNTQQKQHSNLNQVHEFIWYDFVD